MTPPGCSGQARRQWLFPAGRQGFLLGLLALVLTASSAPATGVETKPLNVVLILADDLGWADLGCYGSDLHETPNIDRLAAMGVRFTDAYAAAPVCSPTRASIMTGKHPARLHMTTWYESAQEPAHDRKMLPAPAMANLPLEELTIAKALHRLGHLTALVGKSHLGDAVHYPEAHGFDIRGGDWKLLDYYENGRVELYNLKDDLSEKNNLAQGLPVKAAELQGRLHAWLREVGAQKPVPNPDYKPPTPRKQAPPRSEEQK